MAEPDFRRFVEESADLFATANHQGFLVWVSPQWERTLGWSPEELTAKPFLDFVHPDDVETTIAEASRLADGGEAQQFRNRYRCRDGSWRWLEWNSRTNEDGLITCVVRDVTERMSVGSELARRVGVLQSVEAMAGVGHWWVTAEGDVHWSPQMYTIHARDPAREAPRAYEALGYFVPEDQDAVSEAFTAGLMHGACVSFEARIQRDDGVCRWVELRGSPLEQGGSMVARLMGVMRDITDTRSREEQLRQQVDQAQAASRAKSAFLANTSHEIRTPMTAILGVTELLALTSLEDEQRRHLSTIHSAGGALLELIDEMLDLARIESGELVLDPVSVDLRELLEEQVRLHAAKADPGRVDVSLDWRLPISHVLVDPLRMRQVIGNLLGNAVKFTSRGQVVARVTGTPRDERVEMVIEVVDTGPGIAGEAHRRIFDAFSQADESTTRRYGGTGLGLTICRAIVEEMGGSIAVESGPSQGATFRVELSLPLADAVSVGRESESEGRIEHRVLLVEDTDLNREVLTALLTTLGCVVTAAASGEEAVELATTAEHDLILMDVQMPGMDGREATRRIRRWELESGRARTRIWGLSAAAMEADRERGAEAGMDDYLAKPIRLADLSSALQRLDD